MFLPSGRFPPRCSQRRVAASLPSNVRPRSYRLSDSLVRAALIAHRCAAALWS